MDLGHPDGHLSWHWCETDSFTSDEEGGYRPNWDGPGVEMSMTAEGSVFSEAEHDGLLDLLDKSAAGEALHVSATGSPLFALGPSTAAAVAAAVVAAVTPNPQKGKRCGAGRGKR